MNDFSIILDQHFQAQLELATNELLHHGVVAFPTETVMGLGVVYDDEFAYHRLNSIKRRPEDKPYSLMVQSPSQIQLFAEVSDLAQRIIDAFLPGPLTLLLPVKDNVPEWVTHGGSVIGIRVSSDQVTEALLNYVGKPLLAPSANRSGEPPCMDSDEVRDIFGDELDFIVDGKAGNGSPSTIIDLTGDSVRLVRQGEITLQQIEEVAYGK